MFFSCSYLHCTRSSHVTLHCSSFVLQTENAQLFTAGASQKINFLGCCWFFIYVNLHAVNCSKTTTQGDLQFGLTAQHEHQHMVLISHSKIWRTSYMGFPFFRCAGVDLQREQPLWVQRSGFFFFLMTCSACQRAAGRTAGVKRVLAGF